MQIPEGHLLTKLIKKSEKLTNGVKVFVGPKDLGTSAHLE